MKLVANRATAGWQGLHHRERHRHHLGLRHIRRHRAGCQRGRRTLPGRNTHPRQRLHPRQPGRHPRRRRSQRLDHHHEFGVRQTVSAATDIPTTSTSARQQIHTYQQLYPRRRRRPRGQIPRPDNVITNNRVFDNDGIGVYSIDLPNGGTATITGNVIQQGPNSQNPAIIAYGEEGIPAGYQTGATVPATQSSMIKTQVICYLTLAIILSALAVTRIWADTGRHGSGGTPSPGSGSDRIPWIATTTVATSHQRHHRHRHQHPYRHQYRHRSNPLPPPPTLSIEQYHAAVIHDFMAWLPTHPAFWSNPAASATLAFEMSTKTVPIGIPTGDLWSH